MVNHGLIKKVLWYSCWTFFSL